MPSPNPTIAWYDTHAESYAADGASWADLDQIDEFIALLPEKASILDVGCGSGRDSSIFHNKGFQVTGIDLSENLIAIAKENFPDLEFIHGSMTKLPFPDKSFDGLWVHASLLHLETDEEVHRALSEFQRVLKSAGVLHLTVKAVRGGIETDRVTESSRFFRYYTAKEVREMLTLHDFKIHSLETYTESDKWEKGRPDVNWIVALARKTTID